MATKEKEIKIKTTFDRYVSIEMFIAQESHPTYSNLGQLEEILHQVDNLTKLNASLIKALLRAGHTTIVKDMLKDFSYNFEDIK